MTWIETANKGVIGVSAGAYINVRDVSTWSTVVECSLSQGAARPSATSSWPRWTRVTMPDYEYWRWESEACRS